MGTLKEQNNVMMETISMAIIVLVIAQTTPVEMDTLIPSKKNVIMGIIMHFVQATAK